MTSITSKHSYDVAVVGAGPAGVMAAIRAAGKGLRVLILEKNEKPLKKLYATGNGRCNFSNFVMDGDVYRGSNAAKIRDIVSRFDRDSLIAFFENIGMMTKDIDGYFYPYNEQARTVASALLMEAERLGVEVRCDEQVVEICRIVEDAPETVNPDGENLSLRSSTGRDKVFRYIIKTGNTEYRC
ncbi:MAG: NAD(P)/FAD-dependent oxidoreductase, partial [Lachnospiraceae bacterium]|nr:NAD(P)/FAD-dependent oxidoreductase [Lachnospiraceae bacterium]